MVDETTQQQTDATNANTAAINTNTEAKKANATASVNAHDIVAKGLSILGQLSSGTISAADAQNKLTAAFSGGTVAALAFNNAILGAGKSLSQVLNIDTTNINAFSNQFKNIQAIMERSPGAEVATKGFTMLRDVLSKTGIAGMDMAKLMSLSGKELLKVAEAAIENADNQNVMIESMMKAGAASGDLQTVLLGTAEGAQGFGEDMLNVANVLNTQEDAAYRAAKATGVDLDVSLKYAAEIRKMPGGFEALSKAGAVGGSAVNVLSDAFKVARATGRDMSEVMDDMKTATREYNLTVDQSIQFSARMGEITRNTKIPIDMVHSALKAAADSFSIYSNSQEAAGKNTDSLAKKINELAGSLRNSGVNMKDSIGLAQNYVAQIGKMDIAQKAFLSAQTGGPGGLMGAFDIQDMIEEGNLTEVFDKVKQQMESQLGPIVTTKEAKESPEAAMQLTRQMQLLRQGPLGQFAKTDTEAIKMLQSMQQGKAPEKLVEDPQELVQQTLEIGNKLQEQTHNELTNLINDWKHEQLQVGRDTLKALQDRFTGRPIAAGGTDAKGAGIRTPAQQAIQAGRATAGEPGASTPKTVVDKLIGLKDTLPAALSDKLGKYIQSYSTPGGGGANTARMDADLRKSIAEFTASDTTGGKPDERAAKAKELTDLLNQAAVNQANRPAKFVQPEFAPVAAAETPGRQVGRAATTATTTGTTTGGAPGARTTATTGPGGPATAGGPMPVTLAGGALQVQFTGVCPHCQKSMGEHSHATSQAIPKQ